MKLESQILVERLLPVYGQRIDARADPALRILETLCGEVPSKAETFHHSNGEHPKTASRRKESERGCNCGLANAALAGNEDQLALEHHPERSCHETLPVVASLSAESTTEVAVGSARRRGVPRAISRPR